MGKYSRCIIDIRDNDMQYPELHKKHSNMDGDIIICKLPKDGAVWINTILKGRKQLIQESLHTFLTTSLLNPSPVFKWNQSKSSEVVLIMLSVSQVQVQYIVNI